MLISPLLSHTCDEHNGPAGIAPRRAFALWGSPMASGDISVSASDAMATLTLQVKVKGCRRMAARGRVGVWLLHAARVVMGCRDLDVEFVEERKPMFPGSTFTKVEWDDFREWGREILAPAHEAWFDRALEAQKRGEPMPEFKAPAYGPRVAMPWAKAAE